MAGERCPCRPGPAAPGLPPSRRGTPPGSSWGSPTSVGRHEATPDRAGAVPAPAPRLSLRAKLGKELAAQCLRETGLCCEQNLAEPRPRPFPLLVVGAAGGLGAPDACRGGGTGAGALWDVHDIMPVAGRAGERGAERPLHGPFRSPSEAVLPPPRDISCSSGF